MPTNDPKTVDFMQNVVLKTISDQNSSIIAILTDQLKYQQKLLEKQMEKLAKKRKKNAKNRRK